VLVSSISPIMGNEKQANYASGNAFLDGLAFHRRAQGLKACAVNFGLISGVGYVAEHMSFDSAQAADYALNCISPEEVWSVMEAAMTGWLEPGVPTPPQIITCAGSGGLTQRLRFMKTHTHTGDPKYRYLNVLDTQGSDDSHSSIRRGREELSKQLELTTNLDQALHVVEKALVEKLASAIPMSPEDVDPSRPISSYGVDSLIAHELRNWATNVVKANIVGDRTAASSDIALMFHTECGRHLVRKIHQIALREACTAM
jgi:hypothetical protein